ncbi:MAG TPA: DNA polymerase III subunit gamma/tau [Planctomycetota bacterium]|jgi:DNA polymerase-3 subunit gamma/tau|nr:DNA polymerase III subunit gamma/tau [Planctomycetota bacterium]
MTPAHPPPGSYEPFTLKYRPRVFADVVGHQAVAATLRRSVEQGRVPNAFLFCGSRGVGKTSFARILAKALNCPNVAAGEPCGVCEICKSIARGEDMDVIEVDGASNRGIDEIRLIRDNVGYAPVRSKHKVYIIDEVHMLTVQAFNALLKTLEEPPPHVRFIFATTEAHLVPETIISRCQKHEFRRISVADIVERLGSIAEKENLQVSKEILEEIARRSEGGLRDSLSLLDQLVAYAGETPAPEDLDRVLGRLDRRILLNLMTALGEGDLALVLDAIDESFETGRDASDVLDQLVDVLRGAMVRAARGLPSGGEGMDAPLIAAARSAFDLDRLLLALRLCLNARREMRVAGLPRYQLEVTLLKIARSRDLLPLREALSGLMAPEPEPAPIGDRKTFRRIAPPAREVRTADRAPVSDARPTPPPAPTPGRPPAETQQQKPLAPQHATSPDRPPAVRLPPTLDVLNAEWKRVVALVKKGKPRIGSLLEPARPASLTGTTVVIRLPAGQKFHKQQLETSGKAPIEDAILAILGTRLQVVYEVPASEIQKPQTTERRIYEHPSVRKLLDAFSGSVVRVESLAPEPDAPRVTDTIIEEEDTDHEGL